MFKSKKLMIFLFMGAVAMLSACGDDEPENKCGNGSCDSGETITSCAADCKAPPVCNTNGTCDDGENFGNCAADCNNLCTGTADLAFRKGPSSDGSWADVDCAGIAQNNGCMGAGMVGAELPCGSAAASTSPAACGTITGCVWAGTECIPGAVAACITFTDETSCQAAGCVFWDPQCLPIPTEAKCTAGSAILKASKDFECAWNSAANMCWYPKTGADLAGAAASECGLSCLANADPVACTLACMLGPDQLGTTSLTGACVTCYAAVLDCTLEQCIVECSAISAKCDNTCNEECFTALTGCQTCRTDKGCDAVFDSCSEGT